MSLIAVAEAQARLFALAPRVGAEVLPLAAATGRWLAEPVIARRSQPAADLSAMDGYALRFADLGAPLRVIGESAAGRPFGERLGAGEAVRIFTGAALPEGADAILVQEEAARDGDVLTLAGEGPGTPGRHIRRRGADFAEKATVLPAGARLTPPALALAAAAGHGVLSVNRPIRVAIAATGDELVPPGTPTGPAQLPEANGVMLAALLADLPVVIEDLGILPDQLEAQAAAFALVSADLLVTSGGASVGDHDQVRPALLAAGATIDFWRIALRPGKPLMAGRRGAMMVLGLPGNPVSAFVTAMLFVRPLIAAMAGAADPLPRRLTARLGAPLPANDGREDYLRGALVDGVATAAKVQDSGMLTTLAGAGCLIVRAPHAPAAEAGETVEIVPLA